MFENNYNQKCEEKKKSRIKIDEELCIIRKRKEGVHYSKKKGNDCIIRKRKENIWEGEED